MFHFNYDLEPYSMQPFIKIPWKKAKNEWVWNGFNKKLLDFSCGIFVQNFGHSNKYVKHEIKKQINSNLWHTYLNYNEIRTKFLKKLLKYDSDKRALLLSSGTEATEAAIKLMNLWGETQCKKYIISFQGSMHGRTMGAELLKGSNIWKNDNFIVLPYPNKTYSFYESLKHYCHENILNYNMVLNKIAGIMIEAYRGWDLNIIPKDYINQIITSSKENNFLIGIDCIQSGFYRTGTKQGYSFLSDKLNPDLICYGKGIGGGLPLSCVIGNEKIMNIPEIGEMSSTHSANPLSCAAGYGILKQIDKLNYNTLSKNLDLWFNFSRNISVKYKNIIKINRINNIGALIFKTSKIADKFVVRCYEKGLIVVHTGKNSVKLAPPITIRPKNLILGFKIIKEVLDEFSFKAFGNSR